MLINKTIKVSNSQDYNYSRNHNQGKSKEDYGKRNKQEFLEIFKKSLAKRNTFTENKDTVYFK